MNATRNVGENVDGPVETGMVGPNAERPFRSAGWPAVAALFSAIEEGLVSAARYESLARKTNGELANLGVDRANLPRFVMFGDA
jgi:hypothetical protein